MPIRRKRRRQRPYPPAAGPAHQFDRYYKDGAFDSCRARFSELSFCVKLKAASGDQAADMLRGLLRDERTTEGVVWRLRPGPPPPLAPPAGQARSAAGGR